MSDPWTTRDEKLWIDTMGQHDQSIKKVPYIELLERYLEAAKYRDWETDRKSTRLNSSHSAKSRMPSSA